MIRLYYSFILILVIFYLGVTFFALRPRVGAIQQAYFVDRQLRYWPGSGGIRYTPGAVLDFSAAVKYESRDGWSEPEDWGTRIDGDSAGLTFDLPPSIGDLALVARARGFGSVDRPIVEADVLANGTVVAHWKVEAGLSAPAHIARIPAALVGQDGRLAIIFRIMRPSVAMAGSDDRDPGIGFATMVIEPDQVLASEGAAD